jgi:hypothetical protein
MAASETDFIVWGIDQTAYGPVELPALISWVRDERVTEDTWLFVGKTQAWQRASEVPELHMFFRPKGATASSTAPGAGGSGIPVRALRRIKILADMTDEQLERFAAFTEAVNVPQWAVIVKQGDHGDSMYLILEGELRVRLMVGDKETILTTLGAGEFFGDIALFDHGPRSADVVANVDSLVVKVAPSVLDNLAKDAPDLAALFLRAVGKTLTARIRADDKRYGDSVRFARASH